jgi:lipopolysaccharide transport system ATP-binding protein
MSNKNIILKAENISKQYRLGTVGTGTLSHDLNRLWHKIRGKEDPYLKIGDTNDRSLKGESEYVWALKDINFEVERGEVLGIIGKNGSGKSTLLKILSKVTSPTTGLIKSRGRIASLLEVGTGFNPELTGRENIYLNGAILGMTKKEITSKLDEIIEFSGCQRYIDTPTKRYSSGMTVRLAFAVAAFLDSEILIVDEVLAVGDAEFQKKCLGKMGEISKSQGRTVLFVSHNMGSVAELCDVGFYMKNGNILDSGDIQNCINKYNSDFSVNQLSQSSSYVEEVVFFNEAGIGTINNLKPVYLKIKFKEVKSNFRCLVYIKNNNSVRVTRFEFLIENNKQLLKQLEYFMLTPGDYSVTVMIVDVNSVFYLEKEIELSTFTVIGNDPYGSLKNYTTNDAIFMPKLL